MSNKTILDDKFRFQLPMAMYDTTNSNNKNLILETMVSVIKKNGNIFLLGYPTTNIIMLMLKLYHENIVRIVNSTQEQSTQEQSTQKQSSPLMFMTGMLEYKNEIYVTISESKSEGLNYDEKFNVYYSLLKNSGCDVEFVDGTQEDGTQEIVIDTSYSYRTGDTDFNKDNCDTIKDLVFFDEENKLNYSSIIKDYKITVKLINGTKYIKKRESGFSFMPFKRINSDDNIECIYGSLCVEAKLFSYMYGLGKKWDDFDGYVAYWIGNKLPPNHILLKYNYIKGTDEEAKLNDMIDIAMSLINKPNLELLNDICVKSNTIQNSNIQTTKFIDNPYCKNIFINSLQPIALTCPGCYMNWQSYINNIQSKWDYSVCKRVTRGGKKSNRGGKKKHTTKKHKPYKKNKSSKKNLNKNI